MIRRFLQMIFEPEQETKAAPPVWVSYTVQEKEYDAAMRRMRAVSRLEVVR